MRGSLLHMAAYARTPPFITLRTLQSSRRQQSLRGGEFDRIFVSLTLPGSRPPPPGPDGPRFKPDHGVRLLSIADISAFMRRHAYTLLIPLGVALILAFIYVHLATPLYTARAQLIIDPRIPEQLRMQPGESVVSLDTAQVESQIAVLRSERIAIMVIEELHLQDAADFRPRPSVIGKLLSWLPRGGGEPSDVEKARRTIETFAEGLDVRRAGLSYAIDVSFSSPDPARAAQIANATAEAYIQDQLAARSQAARIGGDWLETRMLELRTQMNAAARAVQEFRASHDYRIPRSREDKPAADGPPGAAPATQAGPRNTLEELETTAQIYRRVYESFLQGFTEAVQRQSFPVSDARILTPATAPLAPSEPRGKLILALGALLGTTLGFSLALIRHHLDHTVRSPPQIRSELGIECMGQLPLLPAPPAPDQPLRLLSGGSRAITPPEEEVPDTGPPTEGRHYFDEVLKPADSGFRSGLLGVKTLIEVHGRAAPIRCIGVTSVNPGEGKSTVASNLATLFAAAGRRVLIVDANPRSRSLTRKVAPNVSLGLFEVLEGTARLDQVVVPVARGRVDLLPVTDTGCTGHSRDVVGSDAMHMLLLETVQTYEIVIVDLPALIPVDAGLSLTAMLDGIVIAAQSGKTSMDGLAEATHWLYTARAKVLGAVLTKT